MSDPVRIVAYEPRHRRVWAELNEAWIIGEGFEIEPSDRLLLDDPDGQIISKGGQIFMAEDANGALGCVAVKPMADGGLEVTKMTVTPAARGRGVARRLLEACAREGRRRGAPRLWLETNSRLTPALTLYRSFGFADLPRQPSAYARSDVQMELGL
ncbi:GNAT family N-acetyltransferase [Brevundimonas sp. 2R-24]|uniref:GNAT family N-acetyltransferase n=1 Tax=Peiella sedimenti TaxID=3061083 RepID=A0ABT8SNV8_9CAUL|nr:GNAT family N-acetyltransferase [Caulobacteraceae bacterium XZ-24]